MLQIIATLNCLNCLKCFIYLNNTASKSDFMDKKQRPCFIVIWQKQLAMLMFSYVPFCQIHGIHMYILLKISFTLDLNMHVFFILVGKY